MSLIHTAERCGAAHFAYLSALQKHARKVGGAPAEWMPWNYADTLARVAPAADADD